MKGREPQTAEPKILVINGHGAKYPDQQIKVTGHLALITPGDPEASYEVHFDDQNRHLEEKTHRGELWPIIDKKTKKPIDWQYHHDKTLSDVEIAPLQDQFDFGRFASEIARKGKTWEDWSKLTNPAHDPLQRGALAIELDGQIQILEGGALTAYLASHESFPACTPLFYCDKELGKIKPLGTTSLSAIYAGVALINEFKQTPTAIVVATCSPASETSENKHIVVKTKQPAKSFQELFSAEPESPTVEPATKKVTKQDIYALQFKGIKQQITANVELLNTQSGPHSSTLLINALVEADKAQKEGNIDKQKAYLDYAKFMIAQPGIKLDLQDRSGSTALHRAAWYGFPEVTRLLLEKGASPLIRNGIGETVLDNIEKGQLPQKGQQPQDDKESLKLLAKEKTKQLKTADATKHTIPKEPKHSSKPAPTPPKLKM